MSGAISNISGAIGTIQPNALVLRLDEGVYRSHRALARSSLDYIMVSPAHFKKRLTEPQPDTASMRFGRLAHGIILEPEKFWPEVAVYEGAVRKGKAWESFKSKAEANGKSLFLNLRERAELVAVSQAVKNLGIDLSGHVESSIFWQHESTGVELKARLDLISGPVIYDLKTTSDLDGFAPSITAYGYHRQAAWYLDGARAAGLPAREFVFLVVEKKEPYRAEVVPLSEDLIALGREENEANLTLYKSCLDANHWPEHQPEKREEFMTEATVTPIENGLLQNIRSGKKQGAWKAIIYGQPGIGKSTLASYAPKPFFLDLEDGLKELEINGTPDLVKSYEEMKDWLRELMNSDRFETIVIDTVDVVEKWLSMRAVETWNRNNKPKVKAASEIPWGKDGGLITDEWRDLIEIFEHVNRAGKNVLLVGPQKVEKFTNPMDLDYEYFTYNIHKKALDYVTGKLDAVLYCRKEQIVNGDRDADKGKAVTTGRRLVYTDPGASYTAKNRWKMPAEVPMDRGLFDLFK